MFVKDERIENPGANHRILVHEHVWVEPLKIIGGQTGITGIENDVIEARIQDRRTISDSKFDSDLTVILNRLLRRALANGAPLRDNDSTREE